MSYSVKILARAKEDFETIVAWIAEALAAGS